MSSSQKFVIREANREGDLGWVLFVHGEFYFSEYNWKVEAISSSLIAQFANSHNRIKERGWIAEVDNNRVGCVFCTIGENEQTAQLRLLFLSEEGRGLGIGKQLLETCINFARNADYDRICLWTHEPLTVARKLYASYGFKELESEVHHKFGIELKSFNCELKLK